MTRQASQFFVVVLLILFAYATGEAARTIELILDASGSMNARLPDNQTRIDAAKKAVEILASTLPPDTQLAFRVYGHQSPREKHDCNDTQLMVPFGSLSAGKPAVIAKTGEVKAQGYTPITKVITLAASDFPADAGDERIIILVSDGKETCEGDPCAAARALAAANVKLTIHTIGFAVDTATRYQLKCIANATGGTYFDAEDAGGLAKVLGQAAVAQQRMEIPKKGGGFLEIKGPNMTGHNVFDVATGKQVANISPVAVRVNLPSGIYHVQFGDVLWKSVEVKAGQTTLLEPGFITVKNATMEGHQVKDSETGTVQGEVSGARISLAVIPGLYDVSFGPLLWSGFKVNSGETVVLNPGIIQVKGATMAGHPIKTAKGLDVGDVSSARNSKPLPPGEYTIELRGKKIPFTLAEGQVVVLSVEN